MRKSVKVKNLRSRALNAIEAARKEIAEAAPTVRAIRQGPRLSEEGKREGIKEGLAEIRNEVSGEIAAVQRATRETKEGAERKLEELRHVLPASTASRLLRTRWTTPGPRPRGGEGRANG